LYRELPREALATNSSADSADLTNSTPHEPLDGNRVSFTRKNPSPNTGDAIADDSRSTPLTAEPVHEQTTQTVSAFTDEPFIRMETSNPLKFSEIIIAPNMFLDHMPSAYETAFEQARQCFIRNAATKKQ
jgi:hypothetical protein